MTAPVVVRGGRVREQAERVAQALAQQDAERTAQRALDTRTLLASPAFRRWMAYWLGEADVLTVVSPTTPHDALRAQLGKQHLGMRMLKELQEIDPSFVTEFWTTHATTSDPTDNG